MAADKALIAGAATVAGAKAKVDYATTKAFTELGEDILENSQKVQADMKEAQNELNDLYDKDLSEIRTNAYTLDTDVATSMFGTPDVVGTVDAPSTAANEELDKVGARGFDFYDASKKGDIAKKRKEAQMMVSITNAELDKLNESKKIINDGFEKSQFTEIKHESYIIYDQYLKEKTKWVKGEETGKSDRYGYELEDGTFVTRSEMDKHRQYYFQKDNSAEFANFLEDSTKRRFKSATTNAQAEIIFNDEKEKLNSDIDNLEKFVINRMGPNTTKDGLGVKLADETLFLLVEQDSKLPLNKSFKFGIDFENSNIEFYQGTNYLVNENILLKKLHLIHSGLIKLEVDIDFEQNIFIKIFDETFNIILEDSFTFTNNIVNFDSNFAEFQNKKLNFKLKDDLKQVKNFFEDDNLKMDREDKNINLEKFDNISRQLNTYPHTKMLKLEKNLKESFFFIN